MKFGISTFVTDDGIDPVSLARAIEERNFDSLVIAEHTHIPASRESAYPMGGELPSIYYRTLDPFVTLAAAAAVTSRIELFTGIALLIQRDPITTAKEAASIDLISNGRFVFGVGAGWNLEELRNHGTDPKTRGACSTSASRPSRRCGRPSPPSITASTSTSTRRTSAPSRSRNRIRPSNRRRLRCHRQASDPTRGGLDLQPPSRGPSE